MSIYKFDSNCNSAENDEVIDAEEKLSDNVNFNRRCIAASSLSYYDLVLSKYDSEVKVNVVAERFGASVTFKSMMNIHDLVVTDCNSLIVDILYKELLDRENRYFILKKFHVVSIIVMHDINDKLVVIQGGNRIAALKRYSRHCADLNMFLVDIVVKENQCLPECVKLLLSCLCYGPVEKPLTRRHTLTEMVHTLKKLSLIENFFPIINHKRSLDETIRSMMFCLMGQKPTVSMIRRFLLFSDVQYSIIVPAFTDLYITDCFWNVLFPTFEIAPRKLFNVLSSRFDNGRVIDMNIISKDRFIHDWDILFWKLFSIDKYPKWHVVDDLLTDIFPKDCKFDDTLKEKCLDLFFTEGSWRSIVRTRNVEKRRTKFIKDFHLFLSDESNLVCKKQLVTDAYITVARKSYHTPFYCDRVILIAAGCKQFGSFNSTDSINGARVAICHEETNSNVSLVDHADIEEIRDVNSFVPEDEPVNIYENVRREASQCFNELSQNSYVQHSEIRNYKECEQVSNTDCNFQENEFLPFGVSINNVSEYSANDNFFGVSVECVSSASDEECEQDDDFFGLVCEKCFNVYCECLKNQTQNLNRSKIGNTDNAKKTIHFISNSVKSCVLDNVFKKVPPSDYIDLTVEDELDMESLSDRNVRKRPLDKNNEDKLKKIRLMDYFV